MVPDRVQASRRRQRGGGGHEVFGFKTKRRSAVPPRVPQREDDAALAIDA